MSVREHPDLPTWDGPRFGRWLRRWKESEGLGWNDISERSGLATGTLQGFARGVQGKRGTKTGVDPERSIDPSISSVARLAQGLGLELAYVVRQAGIDPHNDRWANFNQHELHALADAMRAQLKIEHAIHMKTDPLLFRLLEQLEAALPSEEPEND